MNEPVNRLATPLPDSVLDRFFLEHPTEIDHRRPKEPDAFDVLRLLDGGDQVAG